ncbi:MAG: CdaR family protein [Candidatus Binatia bacterium]
MKVILERFATLAASNLGLGVLSFVIAVGLWIAGHRDIERAIEVPIEFRNVPPDLMVMDNRVDYVVLRLSGPRTLVSTLDADDLRLGLDLSGAKPGSLSYPLGPSSFNIPRGVTVARITPPVIQLRLEPVINRILPVTVRLLGKPAPGYKTAEVVAQPDSVSVQGPAEEVRRMTSVETLPIDLAESRSSIRRNVRLSGDGKPVSYLPDQITVTVTLVEEELVREFDRVELTGRGAGGDYEITPKTMHLRLSGPRQILERFELGADQVFLNLKGLSPGEHSLPASFNLPPEIKVLEQKPARFKVKITKFRS